MSATRPRQNYEKPVLQRYGRVTHLTRGGVGSGFDGGMASMTMGGWGMDGMGTMGMGMGMSDVRCKTDVVRVGSHPAGFGLYLFRYLPAFRGADDGGRRHFGVLAQEVEVMVPEAVQLDAASYRRVNYDLLGICRVA